ncbi:unnamed protein product [Prorocentrum cordatum]|uniref:Uncharacterized protein n=1 Tax=Prorocentrum cordatum TaxID=2364126 RepID=A0ABN9VBD6_9DINO|nr:unnamed protein product [Polarella glacialis]
MRAVPSSPSQVVSSSARSLVLLLALLLVLIVLLVLVLFALVLILLALALLVLLAPHVALVDEERTKRTRQLARLQREYALGDLSVEVVSPATRLARRVQVAKLRGSRRVVALYGSGPQLEEALEGAMPYRTRLSQSEVVVVPTATEDGPFDAGEAVERALGRAGARAALGSWLADAEPQRAWRRYFDELLEDRGGTTGRGIWVALNFRGRVLGSNFGCPIWDELLAAVPPRLPLISTEAANESAESADVLAAQARFYEALVAGDEKALAGMFVDQDDPELSFALEVDEAANSNLSDWAAVLAEGVRPEITTAGHDCVLRSAGDAVSTCVEFPVLGPTLLATQRWRRAPGGKDWKLLTHRSIPYAPAVEARVTLRCDRRGCIAFGKQLDAMR